MYAISFTAEDGKGGSCTNTVQVGVPHDRGKGAIPIDDGQNYDSTVPSCCFNQAIFVNGYSQWQLLISPLPGNLLFSRKVICLKLQRYNNHLYKSE